MRGKPIFFDPTGKRARLLQALAWVAGTLSAVIIVLFTAIPCGRASAGGQKLRPAALRPYLDPLRLGADLLAGAWDC